MNNVNKTMDYLFDKLNNSNIKEYYHGSNVIISQPKIMTNGFYKDFGYGFYCTNLRKQAERWAITRKGESVLNIYQYEANPGLNICTFPQASEDWLDFIVSCRRGIQHHFDIVEGPMADDQIWNYVEDLVRGSISRAAFWELVKFRYPTHQIVFCTEAALQTIKYTGSVRL